MKLGRVLTALLLMLGMLSPALALADVCPPLAYCTQNGSAADGHPEWAIGPGSIVTCTAPGINANATAQECLTSLSGGGVGCQCFGAAVGYQTGQGCSQGYASPGLVAALAAQGVNLLAPPHNYVQIPAQAFMSNGAGGFQVIASTTGAQSAQRIKVFDIGYGPVGAYGSSPQALAPAQSGTVTEAIIALPIAQDVGHGPIIGTYAGMMDGTCVSLVSNYEHALKPLKPEEKSMLREIAHGLMPQCIQLNNLSMNLVGAPALATVARIAARACFSAVHLSIRLSLDPIDPNYTTMASFVPPVFPTIVAGTGLTQAQADVANAWIGNMANLTGYMEQLAQTEDKIAAAAYSAGDRSATKTLAFFADGVTANLVASGNAEQASRAEFSIYPAYSLPAHRATPAEAADVAAMIPTYFPNEPYTSLIQTFMPGTVAPAWNFPSDWTSLAIDYNSIGTISSVTNLCGKVLSVSSVPNGWKKNVTVTVSSSVPDGSVVTVKSLPAGPDQLVWHATVTAGAAHFTTGILFGTIPVTAQVAGAMCDSFLAGGSI